MGVDQAGLEKTFAITVFGGIYLIQAAVPHMPRGGRIINIGSVASKMGIGHIPVYSAAKAAMDSFTYSIAEEVSLAYTTRSIVETMTDRKNTAWSRPWPDDQHRPPRTSEDGRPPP